MLESCALLLATLLSACSAKKWVAPLMKTITFLSPSMPIPLRMMTQLFNPLPPPTHTHWRLGSLLITSPWRPHLIKWPASRCHPQWGGHHAARRFCQTALDAPLSEYLVGYDKTHWGSDKSQSQSRYWPGINAHPPSCPRALTRLFFVQLPNKSSPHDPDAKYLVVERFLGNSWALWQSTRSLHGEMVQVKRSSYIYNII